MREWITLTCNGYNLLLKCIKLESIFTTLRSRTSGKCFRANIPAKVNLETRGGRRRGNRLKRVDTRCSRPCGGLAEHPNSTITRLSTISVGRERVLVEDREDLLATLLGRIVQSM
eukprot:SAG22_NODE_3783_length_1532_cov_0.810188_2_plen_115_part_00